MSEDIEAQPATNPETSETKLSRAEEWDSQLINVKAFAQSQQRWPSTTAESETEKSLAQWWSRQKYYFNKHEQGEKSPGINAARAAAIRNLIASFGAFERDGIWDTRYHLVQMQIKSHNKVWSYKTVNAEEEKVLRWWNQQKTFYRKFRKGEDSGGMTEDRAQKVENIFRLLGLPVIAKDQNKPAQ